MEIEEGMIAVLGDEIQKSLHEVLEQGNTHLLIDFFQENELTQELTDNNLTDL